MIQEQERYRFILGAVLVIGLLALTAAIALGKVEEKTSYGLGPILGVIAKLALDFSEWAFRGKPPDDKTTGPAQ